MSRIGKQPIVLPQGVTMTVADGVVKVKGPKGELSTALHANVTVTIADGSAIVSVRNTQDRKDRALWGLSRVLVANMVLGVTEGFSKTLEVEGVGYRVALAGKTLKMNLGFSHPIEYTVPEGIEVAVDGGTIKISGIDKHLVGETAAHIRSFKKPEPYKGKGIHYVGEHIRRKAGKVVKGSEG